MKVGKFIKKMAFASLAVFMAATVIPYHSSVRAASDDYPAEIEFPIQVLDFRQDNLLFQWKDWQGNDADLELYQDYYGLGEGKGLVEDILGPDGVPVYKKETVETIAKAVQRRLHWGYTGSIIQSGSDLSMRKYVGANESILNQQTNMRVSDSTIWMPDDSSVTYRLVNVNDETKTYILSSGSHTYNHVFAEVYDDSIDSTKPVYILKEDAIIFFYKVSVSRTFTLSRNATYELIGGNSGFGQQQPGKTVVKITDTLGDYVAGSTPSRDIKTGADGKIKVTIEATNPGTAAGGELPDPLTQYGQTYAVWRINLKAKAWDDPGYLGSHPNGSHLSVTYPLGNYDESKAKFDGNPALGWTDIRTCMDYAYFVTSNFFKYHPSLNALERDYNKLIFHKLTDVNGNVSYEFAAAKAGLGQPAPGQVSYANSSGAYNPVPDLIYNKSNGTIRNVIPGDTGDTTAGDRVGPGRSFFIVDEAMTPVGSGNLTSGSYRPPYTEDTALQDVNGKYHNFLYTVKSSSKFVYKKDADQSFYFAGDDDVYVYVNGHLYMDLGGAHVPLNGTVNLDDLADAHPDWGIEPDKVVSLDFFYMERHTDQANFYANMNFKLASDEVNFNMPYKEIPYGFLVDLEYSLTTMRELTTNSNVTFTDNFGNVIGADGFELVDGVSLKDNKLTVTVTQEKKDADGNTIKDADGEPIMEVDDARSKVFTFVDPHEPTASEIAAVKDYFKTIKLRQGDVITMSGPQYDTSYKPYSEYEDISGETVAEKGLIFITKVAYDAKQDDSIGSPQRGSLQTTTPVTVLIGSIKVSAAQENNEKKELADYGAFKIKRELLMESEYATQPSEMPYTNDPDIVGVTEHVFYQVPRGKYTIELDESVLTSYKVTVNDEEVTELTIDFEPEYDPEQETWIYPDVKFELRAKRSAPDLKDLT